MFDLWGLILIGVVGSVLLVAYLNDDVHDWHLRNMAIAGIRKQARKMRQRGIQRLDSRARTVVLGIAYRAILMSRTDRWTQELIDAACDAWPTYTTTRVKG